MALLSARGLLDRAVVLTPDDRPYGYLADLWLDLGARKLVDLTIQSNRPSANADHDAAGMQWVVSPSSLPQSGPVKVDEPSLIPLAAYVAEHPELCSFTRIAAELPIFDELDCKVATVWDLELNDRLRIARIVYRIRRPSGVHRELRIYPDEIKSVSHQRIVVRV